jgi:hypothetical protein
MTILLLTKIFTTLLYYKGEVVISSWFGLFLTFNLLFFSELAFLDLVISCFLSTLLSSEVNFLTTKPKAKLISWWPSQNFVFAFALKLFFHLYSFFWWSRILCDEVKIYLLLYFYLQVNFVRIFQYFRTPKFRPEFF